MVERLSYDAWGKRRFPNGQDDPSGSIASQTTRGFTGHEQLADVGLVHMNGRVYDPMLGRFGTPDPTTESPFSSQGWNRYTYVGNSPLNFTDPTGYCFAGCFWQKPFKALGALLRRVPIIGQILTVAAGLICGPACSSIASAVVTGLASGNLGLALKAGLISAATAAAFAGIGDLTGSLGLEGVLDPELGGHGPLEFLNEAHLFNIAGHAAIGCVSSVASGGKCGPGAASGAVGSFATPLTNDLSFEAGLAVTTTAGGLASVAGGGKFGNGAVTAAFGYLFNACGGKNGCKIAGTAMGTTAGMYASTGCDIGSAGACIMANPLIVGAGTLTGLLTGAIADIIGDWLPGTLLSESAPTDRPPGTRPIDQWGIGKDDIHTIKQGIGATATDWVGVTPEGEIIIAGPNGEAANVGHVNDHTPKPIKKFLLPE